MEAEGRHRNPRCPGSPMNAGHVGLDGTSRTGWRDPEGTQYPREPWRCSSQASFKEAAERTVWRASRPTTIALDVWGNQEPPGDASSLRPRSGWYAAQLVCSGAEIALLHHARRSPRFSQGDVLRSGTTPRERQVSTPRSGDGQRKCCGRKCRTTARRRAARRTRDASPIHNRLRHPAQ